MDGRGKQAVLFRRLCITCATFASYIVPPTDLADRCSVTLTMLLAQVAYKYRGCRIGAAGVA